MNKILEPKDNLTERNEQWTKQTKDKIKQFRNDIENVMLRIKHLRKQF